MGDIIEIAESDEEKERWQGWHRDSLTHLVAYYMHTAHTKCQRVRDRLVTSHPGGVTE